MLFFQLKISKQSTPTLTLNIVPVARVEHTKHLGVYLDSCLNFSKPIRESIRALNGLGIIFYPNMSIKVYLTYINCMFALTLIMEMSYTTTKELMNCIEQVQ